jgi:nucleoside-diphosphate-sugar epimerase
LIQTEAPVFQSDLDEILAGTESLFGDLKGARVLLTGGTGFFGKWIVQSLLAINRRLQENALPPMKISIITRSLKIRDQQPWLNEPAIELVEFDLGSAIGPEQNLGGFDFVLHAATPTKLELNTGQAQATYEAIFSGTQRLLASLELSSKSRFLYISSGAVYGTQSSDMEKISELAKLPQDEKFGESVSMAYAQGKRAAEKLVMDFGKKTGTQVSIARCFSFLGPYMPLDQGFAAGNFTGFMIARQTLRVRGDGSAVRGYLYPTDLVTWLLHILVRAPYEGIYNVGSDVSLSVLELAKIFDGFREALGLEVIAGPRLDVEGGNTISFSANQYVALVDKVKRELSLMQKVSINEAIGRSLRWQKSI